MGKAISGIGKTVGGLNPIISKLVKENNPVMKIAVQEFPFALISRDLGRIITPLEMKEATRLLENHGIKRTGSSGFFGKIGKSVGGIAKLAGHKNMGSLMNTNLGDTSSISSVLNKLGSSVGKMTPQLEQFINSDPFLLELKEEEGAILVMNAPELDALLGQMEGLA